MTMSDLGEMPLGKALAAIRLGLLNVEPVTATEKARGLTMQHMIIEQEAKSRTVATLRKCAALLTEQRERSEVRMQTLKELDADREAIEAEAEIMKMIDDEAKRISSLADEYERNH